MTIDSLLRRASAARYLVLALPLFALTSTVHAGCNTGPNGLYYTTYGNNGNRIPSAAASPATAECVVYRNGYGGGSGGYYVPCDDDDEGDGYGPYGGYGGYGAYGGYGGYGDYGR
jgi:hypothetical protein